MTLNLFDAAAARIYRDGDMLIGILTLFVIPANFLNGVHRCEPFEIVMCVPLALDVFVHSIGTKSSENCPYRTHQQGQPSCSFPKGSLVLVPSSIWALVSMAKEIKRGNADPLDIFKTRRKMLVSLLRAVQIRQKPIR